MIANSSCLFIHIPLTADGGVQAEADGARFVFWYQKSYIQVIVQILLLLGDFLQLHWGLFFFFHLEDFTFVCAASLVWAKQTGWIEQTGALLWLTDECALLFEMKKTWHNRVCVIISLHVCAFFSSRGSDLAFLRLRKLRLKWDLGFCREIISR